MRGKAVMGDRDRIYRFSLLRRIEHGVLMVAFVVLAATGLPQKYPQSLVSLALLQAMGGLENARIIHRAAAIALMLLALEHIGSVLYDLYVRRIPPSILPTREDFRNAWRALRYNLGLTDSPPRQGWFTFQEKFEYWALVWGLLIMGLTGFMLWNPITTARFLPGQWIPAAKVAHGSEALLAVLAILIWHVYHVHIRRFNRSMFTGYLSRAEMEEDHPLALEAPPRPAPLDPLETRARARRFWAAYGVLATLWLVGMVWFVSGEKTAVTSPGPIPDIARVRAYAPLTPTPVPTPSYLGRGSADIGPTWGEGIGAFLEENCGFCHGPQRREGDLDLTTYEGVLRGGKSGPAVIPGAPGISPVLIWTALEDHPGRLRASERAAIWLWIQNGAPR